MISYGMRYEDFDMIHVRRALKNAVVTVPEEVAMLRAMAEKESNSRGRASSLASQFCNLFGVKWYERDTGRYSRVRLPPNEFETAPQDYRIYDSWTHCCRIQKYNMIDHPQVYAKCRAVFDETGDYEQWLHEIAKIYCPVDRRYGDNLVDLYRKYLDMAKSPDDNC